MISRDFVRRRIMEQRADLPVEVVDRLIDDAVRLLSNLIHYNNGRSHVDDDVATAALMIGQNINGD